MGKGYLVHKRAKPIVVTAVLVLASFIIGCSQPQKQIQPNYDIPRLTCRDAIIKCIEYNDQQLGIKSTVPISERINSGDWNCQYLGNGQWCVTLREPSEGNWVWYVYEKGDYVKFAGLQH